MNVLVYPGFGSACETVFKSCQPLFTNKNDFCFVTRPNKSVYNCFICLYWFYVDLYTMLWQIEKLELNAEKNSAAHHTDQYEVDYLVLRRGQSFKFTLKLARALTDEEKATIIVSTGRNPYPSKGTCTIFYYKFVCIVLLFEWRFQWI